MDLDEMHDELNEKRRTFKDKYIELKDKNEMLNPAEEEFIEKYDKLKNLLERLDELRDENEENIPIDLNRDIEKTISKLEKLREMI